MGIRTLRDLEVKGKRVLVRVDFNVPLKDGVIGDETRMVRALPTLNALLDKGASLIVMSHLGRPGGEVREEFSMAQLRGAFARLLGREVLMAPDVVGAEVQEMAGKLKAGEVLLLENTRFYREETANDEGFSKELASLGDVYVNDAFGAAHRAHASTEGVARFLPSAAGLLMETECVFFDRILREPEHPFISVIGGAKVSSKIAVLDSLLAQSDVVVIGGAMAYTFLSVLNHGVGNSLVERDYLETARNFLAEAEKRDVRVILPVDHVVADEFSAKARGVVVDSVDVPEGMIAMDIGRKTIDLIRSAVSGAGMVVWNGPMGVFEFDAFSEGTLEVARMIADCSGTTVVGGGDSVAAVNKFDLAGRIDHVSTGGGASLEFLEGRVLPGVRVLGG